MKIKNYFLISIIILFTAFSVFACGDGTSTSPTGDWVPFEYMTEEEMVSMGMLEDEAEIQSMVDAKISQLEETNKIFWGEMPGDPDASIILFQRIWSEINSNFCGFKGFDLDWDAYKEKNYEAVEFADNYGDYLNILTDMAYQLHEGHSTVYTKRMKGGGRFFLSFNAPVFLSFGQSTTKIGGCPVLTEDQEVVIKSIDKPEVNPYNLNPGDIILGYNGVPWKYWADALNHAKLPKFANPGASAGARSINLLKAAASNAHFFEVINIKRHETGEIETLPIIPLESKDVLWCKEWTGIETPGVSQPEVNAFEQEAMTYGILEGTNIGYIYLTQCPSMWEEIEDVNNPDWYDTSFSKEFDAAIGQLMETDGIIIDNRLNMGGRAEPFYRGFKRIIQLDEPEHIFVDLKRHNEMTDRDVFAIPKQKEWPIMADHEEHNGEYDNPIVVITSPDCISAGDLLTTIFGIYDDFTVIGSHNNGSYASITGQEEYEFGGDVVYSTLTLSQLGLCLDRSENIDSDAINAKIEEYDAEMEALNDEAQQFHNEKNWEEKKRVLGEIEEIEKQKKDAMNKYLEEHYMPLLRKSDEWFDEFVYYNPDDLANGIDTLRERAITIINEFHGK